MIKYLIVVVLFGIFTTAESQVPIGICTKVNSCSCVYDDGTIVNLSPLSGEDGKIGFANISSGPRKDRYFWNPCTPFSLPGNNSCQNAAVCMVRQGIPKEIVYDIGDQDSAQFKVDENGTLRLIYTADKGEFLRVAEITLQCVSATIFSFLTIEGEQDENNNTVLYRMNLASQYSCAKAPKINPANKSSSESLSGGTIFIIILLSLVGAYVIFGVSFQVFVKKESGKRMCPNHQFWCLLPELIKGGCRKATFQSEKPTKYDSI